MIQEHSKNVQKVSQHKRKGKIEKYVFGRFPHGFRMVSDGFPKIYQKLPKGMQLNQKRILNVPDKNQKVKTPSKKQKSAQNTCKK